MMMLSDHAQMPKALVAVEFKLNGYEAVVICSYGLHCSDLTSHRYFERTSYDRYS